MSGWIDRLESRVLFNSISGTIFNDRNNNAAYDSAGPDLGLGSVTVYIDANNNGSPDAGEVSTTSGTMLSGNWGGYQFTNVGTGTFNIRIVLPANFAQTLPANNQPLVVTISNPTFSVLTANIGARDLTQTSRLGGRAWADANHNGTRETGEAALQNVTVWADLDNNGQINGGEPTALTNSSGTFQLNPPNPNFTTTYYVRAVAPAGQNQTAPSLTSNNGAWVVTIDAGNASALNDIFGFADLTPPSVVSSIHDADVNPNQIRLSLSEPNANGNFTVGFALSVKRLSDNVNLQTGTFTLDSASQLTSTLTYNLNTSSSFYPSGHLPDGRYRATLAGNTLKDAAGNTQSNAYSFDFTVLAGDANQDGAVDVSDLGILATNWQTSGRKFSQGDFNYDGTVDVTDLGILATNWQKNLPVASAAVGAVASLKEVSSGSLVEDVLA
jgi:hypothetical protein